MRPRIRCRSTMCPLHQSASAIGWARQRLVATMHALLVCTQAGPPSPPLPGPPLPHAYQTCTPSAHAPVRILTGFTGRTSAAHRSQRQDRPCTTPQASWDPTRRRSGLLVTSMAALRRRHSIPPVHRCRCLARQACSTGVTPLRRRATSCGGRWQRWTLCSLALAAHLYDRQNTRLVRAVRTVSTGSSGVWNVEHAQDH